MSNAGNYPSLQRLEVIRKLNGESREWDNRDLYRLMFKKDMYILAYERMKSAPGNMTPGTDGATLDGMSLKTIDKLIEQMKDESYQCKPVRTTFIPKSNGKLRQLGIPSIRDKLVQEVIRLILEAIYDSPYGPYFSEASHGFRHSKSCHSALEEIQKWSGVTWFLEGDIKACFDDIDHEILIEVLRKKIKDERFLNLIRKLLKAGYMDLDKIRHNSLAGTPQGGIASPILANIYLHELDEFVKQVQANRVKGSARAKNREYHRLSSRRDKLSRAGKRKTELYRKLGKEMRKLPSRDPKDPDFVRIKYVRYADDWVVGIIGSHQLAEEIKSEIAEFLRDKLKLTLSQEKTRITNARSEEAEFLGYRIRKGRGATSQKVTINTDGYGRYFPRRSTGMEIVLKVPIREVIKRLNKKGFCDKSGVPLHKAGWMNLDEDQIVNLYSSINRGIQQYYRPTDNWGEITRIQYILKYSLAKTLALKRQKPITDVIKNRDIKVKVRRKNGEVKDVVFYRNSDWTTNREAFTNSPQVDQVRMNVRLRTRSKLGQPCCICSNEQSVEMHHVRHIRKMDDKKPQGFTRVMGFLNRKQIPVCSACHKKIHRGDYDGISLKELAYDPRKPTG